MAIGRPVGVGGEGLRVAAGISCGGEGLRVAAGISCGGEGLRVRGARAAEGCSWEGLRGVLCCLCDLLRSSLSSGERIIKIFIFSPTP